MLLKTNIPETTQSFAGVLVDFGDSVSDQPSVADQKAKLQPAPILGALGNRCGHVPNDPRFYHRPENHKRRPTVLEKAIDVLTSAYHWPKKFLKKLLGLNPSKRRKRSERREAIASFSQVLMHYLDLVTLHVGFYNEQGKFIALDLEYIANKAGISLNRAKRAASDLAKAGYIEITRQFDKKEDGTFKGLPSIRKVSLSFFTDLGADMQRLFVAREWKRKKQENARAKKNQGKLTGLLKAVTSFGRKVALKRPVSKKQTSFAIEENKDLISTALELHKANPNKSPSDYLKELKKLKE